MVYLGLGSVSQRLRARMATGAYIIVVEEAFFIVVLVIGGGYYIILGGRLHYFS